MRRTAATLFICAVVTAATPTFAAGPGMPPPPPPCMTGEHGPRGAELGPFASPPVQLAGLLAALETGVGIRANQMDAWRQYTDALQALLSPPPPPGQGSGLAFASSSAIATDIIEKTKKAETLLAAIDNLRKTLTTEQLERAKMLETQIPPLAGPRPPFAPPPHIPPAQ